MRNPQRIQPTLKLIEKIWNQVPDLRLGQLIVNVTKQNDPFYVEDETLIEQLKEYETLLKSNKKDT